MEILGIVVLEDKIFLDFPVKKTDKPRVVAIFDPGVILWTNLV